MNLLLRWLLTALAVLLAAYILPGVSVGSFATALLVALVLSLLNTIVKPVLLILTLPITILTLGLFAFVLNALMVMLTSALVPGFFVRNFWWALLFSLIVSLVSSVAHHYEPGRRELSY